MSDVSLVHRLLQRWPAKTPPHPLQTVLEQGALDTLYQPIIALQSGAIDGHEALVRGQKDSDMDTPQALLDAAQLAQMQTELELACVGRALQGWGYPHTGGRLYLNLSAHTLVALSEPKPFQRLEGLFLAHRVPCKRVVVEVTQHRKLKEIAALERCTTALQALGCAIALDDVKASQRSLDLWLRLKPSVVKLDSRMTTDLQQDPAKAKVLRTLSSLAFKTGASLVAKAVEDAEDLRIVRDAGVHLAQGHFLGFPAPAAVDTLNLRARNVLAEKWSPPEPPSQPGELVAADSGLQNLVGMRWFD
jgi:EAL domain-containing protein (putative c-di-GMP-specific phosphodiesterase class I)